MCYSPHPDRPRTPVALLKTEAEPAPPNEWTPDGCQRGCAVKCARRARSQPDAPTNDWRRSSKPQTRPRLVWRPRGREAFLCRDNRPQDRPARQFPKSQFDQLHCYFPPFMVGHWLPFPDCFVVSMLKNLSRFVSASRPENSRRIRFVGRGNPAGVAVAIYSMRVSVKAASVRNSRMRALILNQALHRCRRQQSP
jgi:hypothetical protein